jgi:tetratricopeptide (TPR) repeat protein
VTVCLAAETEITARALDGVDRLLQLGQGRAVVSLVPQPRGTTFSIATSAGKVTAVGTVFSVEIGADGASVARVLHGRVLVRATADGIARPLQAGETMRIGEESATPLSADDKKRDLALLAVAGESEHAALNEASSSASSPVRSGRSAQEELLEQAQALRVRGKFAEAAEIYRKLHAASPQSPSGLAALVSLGELRLSSLGDPLGALNAFDGYLAQGGALAQEAAFGRARALRALKRPQEERRAIERYLATYPDAPQSRVLRHRLTVIAE